MSTNLSAATRAAVYKLHGSVMILMTAEIRPMKHSIAVSDISVYLTLFRIQVSVFNCNGPTATQCRYTQRAEWGMAYGPRTI